MLDPKGITPFGGRASMCSAQSRQTFWNSKEVKRLIADAITCKDPSWQPNLNVQPWEELRHAIAESNSKGRYLEALHGSLPRSYCLDQLPSGERDDGSTSYLRFRYYLGVFSDLLSVVRHEVLKSFGHVAWQKTAVLFEDDAQGRTLFRFLREVSSAARPQAVDCLEKISTHGLRIEWPGGLESWFSAEDCGVKALVDVSTTILSHLEHENRFMPDPDLPASPGERKRVTVDAVNSKLVRLRYCGKEAELRGLPRELFVCLFWSEDRIVSFETLWKLLVERKTGASYRQDRKGGPPPRIRTTKCKLELTLRKKFGPPPGGKFWIDALRGQGYRLNRISVTWQVPKGSPDSPPFISVDPAYLDRRSE